MLFNLLVLVIGLAVCTGMTFICSKMTPPGLGSWEDTFVSPDTK